MNSFKGEHPLASSTIAMNNSLDNDEESDESWNNLIETTQSITRISETSTEIEDNKVSRNVFYFLQQL